MERLMMNEPQILSALICFGCVSAMALEHSATTSPSASRAELEFDHVWIVVTRDALERAALEKAELKISPDVNRHDGQGTALEKGKIDNPKAGALQHEIGVQRITEIRLVRPKGYQPVAAFAYLEKARILQSSEGNEWAVEITFDGGQKSQTKDLRPDLPLVIHC